MNAAPQGIFPERQFVRCAAKFPEENPSNCRDLAEGSGGSAAWAQAPAPARRRLALDIGRPD
jgi:hypothetical protein